MQNLSTHEIKKEITHFLSQERSAPDLGKVIVLKGKWGCGKTIFWKNLLSELKQTDHKFINEDYSYVSLFGIEDLLSLKSETFSSQRKLFSTKKTKAQIAEEKWINGTNIFSRTIGAIFSDYQRKFNLIGCDFLKNSLVCFDDIERISKNLDIKDFFGFVSFLKEQKHSNIILILNSANLEREQGLGEIYHLYKEKIIDHEFSYEPNINDLIKIVFDEDQISDIELIQITNEIINLGVVNIRTIEKIRDSLLKLNHYWTSLDPDIQTISRISIVKIISEIWEGKRTSSDDSLSSLYEKKEFDTSYILQPILEKGWTDPIDTKIKFEEVSNLVKKYKTETMVRDKWLGIFRLIHESVSDNYEDIVKRTFDFFKNETTNILDLNSMIVFLMQLVIKKDLRN